MSKTEQNGSAQELKKALKKLGVKQKMCVSQEVGYETIVLWIYTGRQLCDDDNALQVWFDSTGYITRLTYDEGTTIIEQPTEQELAEYLNKQWNK